MKALFHNLVPSIAAALSNLDIPFTCFSDIDRLYKCDIVLRPSEPKDTGLGGLLGGFMDGILNVGETLLKYDTPAVIKCNFVYYIVSHSEYHHFLETYFAYFILLLCVFVVQGTGLRGCVTMNLVVKLLLVSTL